MAMMLGTGDRMVAGILYVIVVFACVAAKADAEVTVAVEEKTSPRIPPSCSLVMAPSSIEGAGWGVFSLQDRPPGEEIIFGDVVIQVPDLNDTLAVHAQRLALDYGWNAAETGGQYEGIQVMSQIPGIGMLANGSPKSFNVLPKLEPTVDEAEVTRHHSPGAGAFSHYHNFSFITTKAIQAGDEILINYGPNWFQQRKALVKDEAVLAERKLQRSPASLLEDGFCLDNLKPAQSTIPHAGRGALATRAIKAGSIVAPVPVLPITNKDVMDTTRLRKLSPDVSVPHTTKQLWLNYCYGHAKSSVLLFPYSPIVNLINHSSKRPNVKLQWSSTNLQHENLSLEQLSNINTNKESTAGSLLLELVATRDIAEGEEILIDYGSEWQAAWDRHVEDWEPHVKPYVPSYVFEEAVPVLATQEEMQAAGSDNAYPSNLITSCFYPYENSDGPPARDFSKAQWKPSRGIFELRNLRPCTVMQRFEVAGKGDREGEPEFFYTVVIRNRYGLTLAERIPVGHMHVVTGVPRRAIRFTDKIFTTDQHLPGAFRKEIGLGDDIFPSQWMDVALATAEGRE